MREVHGIDVSHWQGKINWQKVKEAGLEFAYLKATEGVTFIDSQFKANYHHAQVADIPVGAYHFFRPKLNPIAQARHFVRVLGRLPVDGLRPVLDVEDHDECRRDEIRQGVRACAAEIARLTGVTPIIYTYTSFWEDFVACRETPKTYPLWIANYNKVHRPGLPVGWNKYLLWQWTQTGTVAGVKGNVDLNGFGPGFSLADLRAFPDVIMPPAQPIPAPAETPPARPPASGPQAAPPVTLEPPSVVAQVAPPSGVPDAPSPIDTWPVQSTRGIAASVARKVWNRALAPLIALLVAALESNHWWARVLVACAIIGIVLLVWSKWWWLKANAARFGRWFE